MAGTAGFHNRKRILAVKTHALGDVLMVTPAIRALRQRYPKARIDFLVGEWASPVLKDNPHIDKIIQVPDIVLFKKKPIPLLKLILKLRSRKYDLAVLFQPSRSVRRLIRFTGAKELVGLSHSSDAALLDSAIPFRKDRSRYVGQDFLDVVRELGAEPDGEYMEIVLSSADMEFRHALFDDFALKEKQYVIVCPAGGHNPRDTVFQKIWSLQGYIEVAQRLMDMQYSVIVTGSDSEREGLKKIRELKGIIDFSGKLTIQQLGALMQKAALVITNDSFPLHLSLAVECPVVPIFGPTRKEALLPAKGKLLPVCSSADCAPCYDNEPFPGCNKEDCMKAIDLAKVWEMVTQALDKWN